jgi:hypothetical protein
MSLLLLLTGDGTPPAPPVTFAALTVTSGATPTTHQIRITVG